MSDGFHELLDATISHLLELKEHGVRSVAVSPESLAALNQRATPVARKPAAPAPAPAPRPAAQTTPPSSTPPTRTASPILSPAPAPATEPALSPEAKAAAFEELRRRALACVKCPHLASSRKNVVFGVGNINAELMFVGEAPGADEDAQGEPFVGKAGQLLTKIIQATGLRRDDVYIANILKCRPDTPGQTSGNRPPTPEEMQACFPYLHEQIDLIRPRVIVALGGTAVAGLLGKKIGILGFRGTWSTYRGTPLMPTLHPSYLLRPENFTKKRDVWQDMLSVMEKLEMPITEKQRGFFKTP